MKKIMYIAAALLVLVGCQKSQEAKENAPVNYGTITGKIELPQGPNKIAAPGGWASASTPFTMQWEKGDKIYITNKSGMKLLTLKSIDGNGVATFEGELLSNMSSFEVKYGFDLSKGIDEDIVVPYIEGNYRPFAMGMNTSAESFEINNFMPVLGMPLKGTAALTKIEASFNVGIPYNLTMTFEDPLQLSSTTQIVYFPITSCLNNAPLTFKFYDAGGLIRTKKINKATCGLDEVITFSTELEVNGTAPAPTYEYVDLGLSVNWATCNVGATNPEEYGDYFAWGETETKTNYSSDTYTYTGNPATLPLDHDAAHVNWGGNWRMPTKAEIDELLDESKCKKEWTTQNNVNGYKFTSLIEGYTDNSIFLPAAGLYDGSSLSYGGSIGGYWPSSLYEDDSNYAYILLFNSEYVVWDGFDRYLGFSVRPVCPK